MDSSGFAFEVNDCFSSINNHWPSLFILLYNRIILRYDKNKKECFQ